jgi:long-chain acyl-CoA synthetase
MSQQEQYNDLVDVLTKSVDQYASSRVFGTKIDGEWQWINYGEFGRRVDDFRGGLASYGIGPGDTVAAICANRVEWAIAAYATYGLGARFCPLYETQQAKDWNYILNDSGARLLLVSTYPIYETTREWIGKVGQLEHVFAMALPVEDESSFLHIEQRGKDAPAAVAEIDSDQVCGFIYTSGTTGKPKGVLLSHGNICSNLNALASIFPVDQNDVSVSFLPWAHSFGQTVELHALISRGAGIAIAESIEKLVDNFGEVKPTLLFAVPRIFNRIYDGLQKRMAEEGGVKKMLFESGMENAEVRKQLAAQGKTSTWVEMRHSFYDRMVFSKVRARFGGRLRYAASGGAALAQEVAEFIDKLGIVVCEGYGLTETSPIVTANHPGLRKLGSVGKPIDGVEVTIDTSVVENKESGDGEIVVRGPNVMKGYHQLPEETRAVLTEDGRFRTGDLGRFDDEGFLFITGRIKEQYKLENGKYVVPAPLEELLQLSPYIGQAFIHGFNKPFNVALLVPDRVAVKKWAAGEGIEGEYEALLKDSRVEDLIKAQVTEYGKDFKGYERVREFELVAEEFSIDNGMLTPKMSLKRITVLERYNDLVEGLYAG